VAQLAVKLVAPVGAPDVPPAPIDTAVIDPGVVAIGVVPVTIPFAKVAEPVTNTSPAPPPPPSDPKPPPPPPPTTSTSIWVTPGGVVQLQLPTVVNETNVTPFEFVEVELHVVPAIALTPLEAGLKLVPFNARSKTV
jgi:hypothetical protein